MFVHDLEGRERVSEVPLGQFEHLNALFETINSDHGQLLLLRDHWAGQGSGCDKPQRALRTDKELLQVVTRVVLAHGGHVVEDGAVGEDGFKPDCIRPE